MSMAEVSEEPASGSMGYFSSAGNLADVMDRLYITGICASLRRSTGESGKKLFYRLMKRGKSL
jgi:hypothetical protein